MSLNKTSLLSTKINVLFLPKWYPSKFDEFDGNFIENHARTVANNCTIGVVFVHSDNLESGIYKIVQSAPHGFIEYRVFYQRPNTFSSLLNKVIGFYRYYTAQKIGYQLYVKEYGAAQLTHVHINGRSALLAVFLKLTANIPFLLTEHWSGYTKENGAFKGFFRKMAYRFVAKQASVITTVSEFLKKAMLQHGIKGNYKIVPNVVNTELFKIAKKSENTIKRIVHISNLSTTPKNMPLIIEALNKVGSKRNDFEFDLIGTGAEEKAMLSKLDRSAIKNRYRFYGEIPMYKVAEVLARADFLVIYSTYETQSVVLIESFACGIPVISSAVGGIPEYMNSDRGMLIEANNLDILVDSIHKMLDNPNKFNQQKLRQYAVSEFDEKVIGKKFMELYKYTLNQND